MIKINKKGAAGDEGETGERDRVRERAGREDKGVWKKECWEISEKVSELLSYRIFFNFSHWRSKFRVGNSHTLRCLLPHPQSITPLQLGSVCVTLTQ